MWVTILRLPHTNNHLFLGLTAYPVNPNADEVEGLRCFKSVSEIRDWPQPPLRPAEPHPMPVSPPIVLYNPYGVLDPLRPFAPFGPDPAPGSFLLVGSPSFLSLSPESVTVRIDWENLPSSFEFADYYAGYGVPVENASYQVAASVLSAGRWIPLSLPDRSLFRREPESPCLVSEFTLTPPKQARKISESAKPLVYDASVTEGFVRLELTAPDFGFGAARYAQAVSETVLKNAADRESRPMPNPPLTPLAKGISVFLNAEGSWHVADAGLLILHPFLSALWERAGIAGFKGGEADHFLAVSLMLYLAWGEGYQARRASPFLKLLAGLPAESVLPPPVPLGNAETALCNSLLAAVVERWDVLKNSSLEALREAFLQRVGRLRRGQDRYDLTVERKTFDVLMDKIPWSYSVLFSPWMERPVHVRW